MTTTITESTTESTTEMGPEEPTAEAIASTQALIESYTDLRRRCYEAAQRDNRALMGKDAALASYWDDRHMQMWPSEHGIFCEGTFWCSTTRDTEFFGFNIPWSALGD